jgi:hypothetical protein
MKENIVTKNIFKKIMEVLLIKTVSALSRETNNTNSTTQLNNYVKGKTSIGLDNLNEFCKKNNLILEINVKKDSE